MDIGDPHPKTSTRIRRACHDVDCGRGAHNREAVMAKKAALEWAILPESSGIKVVRPDSDHDYDLFNAKIGESLVYGERRFGINLVWGDAANSNNIRFARQSGSTSPIKYNQMVAINVDAAVGSFTGERDSE